MDEDEDCNECGKPKDICHSQDGVGMACLKCINKPKWIKCCDKEPPKDRDFLAYFPKNEKWPMETQMVLDWSVNFYCYCNEHLFFTSHEFSHWMELPKGPKDE